MADIGLMGELEVMEYLKKEKGHKIYIPLKDVGLDFLSVGKKGFYGIQVKTSTFQKNSYFWFDLYRNKMIYSKSVFYVLVCKSLKRRRLLGKSRNFIVLPSLTIKKWIKTGAIKRKKNSRNVFNIFVYPSTTSQKWVYHNKGKELDLTRYWNNFNRIK